MNDLILLENDWIQVQISPKVGGSIYSFKYNLQGQWVDIMRPTPLAALSNIEPGRFSSFNMVPYSNRIEHGVLLHRAHTYQLAINGNDGHAIHGEVRNRAMQVEEQSQEHAVLTFNSNQYQGISWPFQFSTTIEYRLQDREFTMKLSVANLGYDEMPTGMGIHPYFVRTLKQEVEQVVVELPMTGIYPGDTPIPTGRWETIPSELDFSQARELTTEFIDRCYRVNPQPAWIRWMDSKLQLKIVSDPVFEHLILYCPKDDVRYFAVEPVTNCNNGFNMANQGIEDTGTVYLEPNGVLSGKITMSLSEFE